MAGVSVLESGWLCEARPSSRSWIGQCPSHHRSCRPDSGPPQARKPLLGRQERNKETKTYTDKRMCNQKALCGGQSLLAKDSSWAVAQLWFAVSPLLSARSPAPVRCSDFLRASAPRPGQPALGPALGPAAEPAQATHLCVLAQRIPSTPPCSRSA